MARSAFLQAGWLIDGGGGRAQPNRVLQIEGGAIQSIVRGPSSPTTLTAKSGVAAANFSDCTVLPGLIDAHVHLSWSDTPDPTKREHQMYATYADARNLISAHLSRHLRHGICAVRDGGDHFGHVLRYRSEIARSAELPCPLAAAGRAWHQVGRYGRLIGRTPAGHASLEKAIAASADHGDHLKIVNSGLNSLTEFGRQTPPQFTAEELGGAVAVAARLGLRTMVHANGVRPVAIAAEAGCDSIEHGFFMGAENLERLAERQITWVPTAVTMSAYLELMKARGQDADVVRRNLDAQLAQLEQARRFGVRVALGTDAGCAGVDHGAAMITEMKLLRQAGYSIEEVVRCACSNGSRALGLVGCGRLQAGQPATLVVVPGSPENLPDSLARAAAVYVNGAAVSGPPLAGCEKGIAFRATAMGPFDGQHRQTDS